MKSKMLEIRDRMTCIPALAIEMKSGNIVQDRFLWRCGYPRGDDPSTILLVRIDSPKAHSDPYDWCDRTMTAAHLSIIKDWETLRDGDVVDARVFLGEEAQPAPAEIWSL